MKKMTITSSNKCNNCNCIQEQCKCFEKYDACNCKDCDCLQDPDPWHGNEETYIDI